MPFKNQECFFPEPGEVESMNCEVCGSVCDVKRNVSGPRSWGGAMAGISTLHDYFYCPHTDEKWHKQVRILKEQSRKTASKQLEKILLDEAKVIILTRQETKEVSDWS